MAHENRTQPDAVWIDGYAVPRDDFESLDRKQFRSVNGDRGGCWAPLVEIEINGSGLSCTGPVLVRGDGTIEIGSGAGITLGDGDFEDLANGHVGRERVIVQPTIPCFAVGAYPWAIGVNSAYASAQPVALQLRDSLGVTSTPEFLVPLAVHNGATLDKVVFTFRVPYLRPAAPSAMPRFRVFRRDKVGSVEFLGSTTVGDGYRSPENPGSALAWYAQGAAQTFEYTCDQNNVVDVENYVYFAHIVEESGATTSPERLPVFTQSTIHKASTTNYASPTGNTNVDGTVIGGAPTNENALFKDQDDPKDNGVWTNTNASLATACVRLGTLDESTDWADGMVFPVIAGNTQSWTVWQASVPTPFTIGVSPITFSAPVPKGNIYHPIALHFSGITSTAWQ